MTDFSVRMDNLKMPEATEVLARVNHQYTQAVDADIPALMVSRLDLAIVIVMASLWLNDQQ